MTALRRGELWRSCFCSPQFRSWLPTSPQCPRKVRSKNLAANSVPGTASSAPREVALTEAGRQLAAWLREDHGSAGVDEAKVARLRVEIEHGTYRLDSTRIAEGLLTSEKDLLRMMDRG